MNLLIVSNLAPSKTNKTRGLFVKNQVDALQNRSELVKLLFLAITSEQTGLLALLKKYGQLILDVVFKAVFSRTTYDVVHVHYFWPTIWAGILYKLFRNPKAKIIVTYHGADIYEFMPPSKLYRLADRFVDSHMFVSEGIKQHFYYEPECYSVLPAGILDVFKPAVDDKKYDLIMIASLDHNKGYDRLFAILNAYPRKLAIAIVGDGPMQDEITDYIKAQKRHKIDFLGSVQPQQLVGYIRQSRYLLSLSRIEAFGLVMCEAMACGVPVIASTTYGAQTQVRDRENGFLLQNDDQDFTSQAIEKIEQALKLADTEQYDKMVEEALVSAKPYQLTHIIDQLVIHYNRLMTK